MFRYILLAVVTCAFGIALYFLFQSGSHGYHRDENSLASGKDLYTKHCASCHALEHDGIGPRLGGITLLLSEKELRSFIRDPEKQLRSGNERARNLQARYKQTMPAYDWLDDRSLSLILSYIDHQTKKYGIKALTVTGEDGSAGTLTGRLAEPVKKSGLKIELEDYVRIPRLEYSSPDLGIVTLRPHPSADGRVFVSDQGGIIYEISNGKATVFLDLRIHVKDFNIGPGIATGLGSFDFHPDYLNNGLIYLTHAEKFKGQAADYRASDSTLAEVQWVLGEWKMDDINNHVFKGSRRELLRLHAPTFGHGAQDIGFIPGLAKNAPEYGLLYFGFGDGGSNNIRQPELGHHPGSFLGTILRIDPSGTNSPNGKYGIPSDNPFVHVNRKNTLKEIWAFGFRNPHRMAWDAANGNRMMVTDIGESNIEELNIVEKGGDYGWPNREGNFGIATKKDLKAVFRLSRSDLDLYKKPFLQYDHTEGYAISGGYVYDGDLAALKGKYVFGDIVNGRLFYANTGEHLTDSTVYEITVVDNGKETDLREMSGIKRLHLRIAYDRFSRQLYVITKADGRIRRVVKAYY